MAFGFTPNYVEHIHLDNLTPQQFLVLAIDISKELSWEIHYISEKGLIATNNNGGMFKWKAKITIRIEDEIINLKSESLGSEMIDLGKNRKTIAQFTNKLYDLKYSFNAEEVEKKYEELKPNFPSEENDILNQPSNAKGSINNFFSILIPKENFFITPILVDVNIAIFILMIISGVGFLLPQTDDLIKWGANFRPITLEGQWWRLITNCFIHIGFIHLAFNMYALLYIGLLLEPYLGKLRFAVAYLLTGIIASLTSLYWHDLTISAGASGAIFGMYGIFLAMLTTSLIDKSSRKALLTSIGIFVCYNLFNGMNAGIDNAAHLGGLISGIIIGYCFYPSLKKPDASNLKYSTVALLSIFIITASCIVCSKMPNDIGKYDQEMKKFASMESKALECYKMPQYTSTQQILSEIKDSGLYYWNENIKLLNELDKLNLPQKIHTQNDKLIEYCNLRINSYRLLYISIKDNTDLFKDSIKYYNNQIGTVLRSLKEK